MIRPRDWERCNISAVQRRPAGGDRHTHPARPAHADAARPADGTKLSPRMQLLGSSLRLSGRTVSLLELFWQACYGRSIALRRLVRGSQSRVWSAARAFLSRTRVTLFSCAGASGHPAGRGSGTVAANIVPAAARPRPV